MIQGRNQQRDGIKIFIAILIAAVGVLGYYNIDKYINNIDYLPVLFLIVGVVLPLLILIFWSDIGARFLRYLKDSFQEVKKVVWPDKSYALKLMSFVIMFVMLLAIYLYGVDTLISWVFSFILRG